MVSEESGNLNVLADNGAVEWRFGRVRKAVHIGFIPSLLPFEEQFRHFKVAIGGGPLLCTLADLHGTAGLNSLRDNAKSLLEVLMSARPTAVMAYRPLVFITHSLRDLICKQMLVLAASGSDFSHVLSSLAGIIFLGKPHQGSKQAKLGDAFLRILSLVQTVNRGIVRTLYPHSERLMALEDDFWRLMSEKRQDCHIHCYYETTPMKGLGTIVDKDSATRPGVDSSSLDGTHSSMLVFASNRDSRYLSISTKLTTWLQELQVPTPSSDGSDASLLPNSAQTSVPGSLSTGIQPTRPTAPEPDPATRPGTSSEPIVQTVDHAWNGSAQPGIHNLFFRNIFKSNAKIIPGLVNTDTNATFNF